MTLEDLVWHPVFLIAVVAVFIAGFMFLSYSASFESRCSKVYEGAAHERCVIRMTDGGPLYEENIGLVKGQ